MATREENLKKINSELKKLDDEQLDCISGGFTLSRGTFNVFENKIAENLQGGSEKLKKSGGSSSTIK